MVNTKYSEKTKTECLFLMKIDCQLYVREEKVKSFDLMF